MACRPKINDLDDGRVEGLEQNVFGLEIAVYDLCFLQHLERVQQLLRENADQASRQPSKLVAFDQLVQIAAQQLKRQT